jgi:hypothetical protein
MKARGKFDPGSLDGICMIILLDFDCSKRLKFLEFNSTSVWIRVFNLLLMMSNKETGRQIGDGGGGGELGEGCEEEGSYRWQCRGRGSEAGSQEKATLGEALCR